MTTKRQIHFTADPSKPWAAPGPALPEELRMETTRTATRRRVSRRRLMLHIKQTKEIANLIVSHSLVQPNISKSDSLSLLQSKTQHNQICLYLFDDLWSGEVSLSLSILLKEIFICHSKSNLVSVWFSEHFVQAPFVIGLCLVYIVYPIQTAFLRSKKWIVLVARLGQPGSSGLKHMCYLPNSCFVLQDQNAAGHQLSWAAWEMRIYKYKKCCYRQ